eukprot:120842-Amphidinium_carterae.1
MPLQALAEADFSQKGDFADDLSGTSLPCGGFRGLQLRQHDGHSKTDLQQPKTKTRTQNGASRDKDMAWLSRTHLGVAKRMRQRFLMIAGAETVSYTHLTLPTILLV